MAVAEVAAASPLLFFWLKPYSAVTCYGRARVLCGRGVGRYGISVCGARGAVSIKAPEGDSVVRISQRRGVGCVLSAAAALKCQDHMMWKVGCGTFCRIMCL